MWMLTDGATGRLLFASFLKIVGLFHHSRKYIRMFGFVLYSKIFLPAHNQEIY